MQALRKIASALIVPTIACLGTACERTATPTEPSSVTAVAAVANERDGGGTTRWVNNDRSSDDFVGPGTSCDDPGYTTVQSAVDASSAGDRINVCPGTYREQVTIRAGKNNIRLRSVERWRAIIKAPAVMLPGPAGSFTIVRVNGAYNVTIRAFTIAGPGPGPAASLHYGVRVDDAGSANILGNHITAIRDEPLSGDQNGVAIQVGRLGEATSGSARIMGNLIDDYQKNGMTVSGAGSSAEIANNRVSGIGPTTIIAQNGIQVSGTATANVRNNLVTQNIYIGDQPAASTGILLFQSGKVVTDDNTATSNDVGIWLFEAGAGSMATDNHARASTFDGIAIDMYTVTTLSASQVGGSLVARNKSDHNGGPGIGLYDGVRGNKVADNEVDENADSGILLDDASNTAVSGNEVNDNGTRKDDMTDGIRINAPSTGNTIRDNRLKNNVKHDCHDGSKGNTWINNHGETSFPRGLCGDKDRDAKKGKVNTESILQLQSAITTTSTVRRATVSPDQ